MSTRDTILAAITANEPALTALPVVDMQQVTNYEDVVVKFTATLESIGGKVYEVKDIQELELEINKERKQGHFVLSAIDTSGEEGKKINSNQTATILEPVHKAYLKASIGVAENGAVWIKESQMINRLLPFICQHLVVVLNKKDLVSNMHQAYKLIGDNNYEFGVFIAGPSKTADIEQSLVLGAHGPKTMTVFLQG